MNFVLDGFRDLFDVLKDAPRTLLRTLRVRHTEEQKDAAARLLEESGLSDPDIETQSSIDKWRVAIFKLRTWVETLPDASERSAFTYWLDQAEDDLQRIEKNIAYRARVTEIAKTMSVPPHDFGGKR